MTADDLKKAIEALDAKIAAAPHWGAYLSVLETERKGLKARLAATEGVHPRC